jgi:phospholipid/cholesterol/gamma-HCH transport system substrate-binding protein
VKIRKEAKIGIVMLLAIAAVYVGMNFLKGVNIFSTSKTYYGVYERVNGLQASNPVVLNGYRIGQVKAITLENSRRGLLTVELTIDQDIDIPKDSKAILRSKDLLGSMQIEIRLGKSAVLAMEGDTLTPDIEGDLVDEVNAQIRPIKIKAEGLISSVDSVIKVIEAILNAQSQQDLIDSFKGINGAIRSLERTAFRVDTLVQEEQQKISAIFSNVQRLSEVLSANGNELDNIIKNFSQISDTLAQADIAQTIVTANAALNDVQKVIEKINSGEGSLGMLINNPDLYNKLEAAADNLDLLTEDLRVNPNRYVHFSVFGRKNKNVELSKAELEELKNYVNSSEEEE